jgi:hypothetical protein
VFARHDDHVAVCDRIGGREGDRVLVLDPEAAGSSEQKMQPITRHQDTKL